MRFGRTGQRGKYGNQPVVLDGVRFASKAEARRYSELLLLAKVGDITDLELQPRYPLIVAGERIATYVADFRYVRAGKTVVEDVKSPASRTPVYKLKIKLLQALHGIEVAEIS
jgi:hypothetical protein